MLLSRCKSNNFFSYIEKKGTNNDIIMSEKYNKLQINGLNKP